MISFRALLPILLAVTFIAVGAAIISNARLDQLGGEVSATKARETQLQAQLSALEDRIVRLSANVSASGGGTNLKMMPDASGQPTVELREVFSFDRSHAFCRVDTNPQPFVMPTFKMGNVSLPAQSFFMAMNALSIDEFQVKTGADGTRTAAFKGNLACSTEVKSATITLGSRTAAEHATYEIVAVDGGPGGGQAGDSFAFTVLFDEQKAPLNYSIFGPKFTFTGRMIEGEITILDPKALAP